MEQFQGVPGASQASFDTLNTQIARVETSMNLDYANREYYASGASVTATKRYYFSVLGLSSQNNQYATVNDTITVSLQDSSSGVYVTSGSGILNIGDKISTNCRLVLIPFMTGT